MTDPGGAASRRAPFDVGLAGRALGERLAAVEAAMERLGAFVFSGGEVSAGPVPPRQGWAGPEVGGAADERMEAARSLALRALATAGDALNFRVLRHLGGADASLHELAPLVGLPAAALWERVGDLVQVGLAARLAHQDLVGLTPAGAELVRLVEELAAWAVGGEP